MTIYVEASIIEFACAIGETIIAIHHDGDVFAILDVDGCAISIGERKVVEIEGGCIFAIHIERAIVGCAAEVVSHRLLQVGRSQYADIGCRGIDGEIASYVASHGNLGCCSIICDVYGIVVDAIFGNFKSGAIVEGILFAFDS